MKDMREKRALHVLDLEYLGHGPACTGPDLDRALGSFRELAGWGNCDQALGAASHWVCKRVAFDLHQSMRLLPAGGGPDAADHCLLDNIDPAWVAKRFGRVVIGSGDHIFQDLIIDLRDRSVDIWVIGYRHNIARCLRAAADRVCYLPLEVPASSAAVAA